VIQERVRLAKLGVAQTLRWPPLALFELKQESEQDIACHVGNRRPSDAAHCRFGNGDFAGPGHGWRSIASRAILGPANFPKLKILLELQRKIGDSRAVFVIV